MSLECLTVETGTDPVGSVVWMHGFGADAHDFEPIVPRLKLAAPLRFIFPNAPLRPITINAGARLRAWYDINPAAPESNGDEIRASVAQIAEIVSQQEAAGIASERIVLAGFSQGGVIAMELGLSHTRPLAGILALSTYLFDKERLSQRIGSANRAVPIFLAHGLNDPMIPISWAVEARTILRALDYRVTWYEYPMQHEVCLPEIDAIGHWLNTIYT